MSFLVVGNCCLKLNYLLCGSKDISTKKKKKYLTVSLIDLFLNEDFKIDIQHETIDDLFSNIRKTNHLKDRISFISKISLKNNII
jgi:hypothetical protein